MSVVAKRLDQPGNALPSSAAPFARLRREAVGEVAAVFEIGA
jgi:hypothetical protein